MSLKCPQCGTSTVPANESCKNCGRPFHFKATIKPPRKDSLETGNRKSGTFMTGALVAAAIVISLWWSPSLAMYSLGFACIACVLWYFVIGLILGLDLIVDRFGLYLAPLLMVGSNSIVPGVGLGISLFRRIGFGVIIPFWMLGVIVPTIIAVIGSAAIGVLLLLGIVVAIIGVARWAKGRIE